jgi:hypothetical protein
MAKSLDLRPMKAGDSNHLLSIDRKSSEFPWEVEDWQLIQQYFPGWEVSVATLNGTPKGFSVIELSDEKDACYIQKLVALGNDDDLRQLLLARITFRTLVKGFSSILYSTCELNCCPGDPYDESVWLQSQGFTYNATEVGEYSAYGRDYDGYIFSKKVE